MTIKTIVTGGAGFIGSHIVDALVEAGHDVHVIDNLVAGKKEYVNEKATLHVVDIRNREELDEIFQGTQYVFHEAALPRVQFSIENPLDTHAVNITGTLNVLDAARVAGVKRFIYAASSSAYGDQKTLPLTETMIAHPLSPYGAQKYMGEVYGSVWNEVYNMETVMLRYFNVYGPRLNPEGSYPLVIGYFLKRRKEGQTLTVTGDGEQTRDFTHIRDVVNANMLAMTSEKVGNGDVINVGAGSSVSVNKIAELIGGEVEFVPARLEPKHTLADNTKARELLGWEPKVSIEEGIDELKKEFGIV